MPAHHDRARRTPDRVADRPTWLISRVFGRSSSMLFGAFDERGDGLRGYHYRLLSALEQWGPASQADLGRDTGIDRSDVTAVLTDLESRELVVRAVDPAHKRRKIVTITLAGLEALRDLDRTVDTVQDAVLAPLTASQRKELLDLLARLVDEPAQD
ncbi:MAG: MarR family winged helix-turn-helix transcriptional regulator [Marmoricola sp.]